MGLTEVRIEGVPAVLRNIEQMTKEQITALRVETKKHAYMAQSLIRYRYSGQALDKRSGLLRRSVLVRKRSRDGWEVGTSVKYAAIHETGGVVKPGGRHRVIIKGRSMRGGETLDISKGRKLAIPIGRARTKRGVAKDSRIDEAARTLARGGAFRTFTGAVSPKLNPDVLYLSTPTGRFRRIKKAGQKGRGKRVRVWKTQAIAALKDQVKIPRSPVWSVASRVIGRHFKDTLDRTVFRVIRKHGGA